MNASLAKLLREGLKWDLSKTETVSIKSGLTNENYFVSNGRASYVARIAGAKSDALGIDRAAELAALQAIASTHLAPPLAYFSATTGDMITRFVPGRHLTQSDLGTPTTLTDVTTAMRKVHSRETSYDFCPYDDINSRLRAARDQAMWLPQTLPRLLHALLGARRRLSRDAAMYRGLCHNDLFVSNIILCEGSNRSDGPIRLIDWECAGMGDIFFDLACVSAGLSRAGKGRLLRSYFGARSGDGDGDGNGDGDATLARRLECMEFVATFWNATWAMVQAGTTKPAADYEGMARRMFASLHRTITSRTPQSSGPGNTPGRRKQRH